MSEQEKKNLVPALRFPEFRNAGGWKKKPLAPYIEQYSERVSSSTKLEVYSSTREGLKPQSEYYDGRNLVNDGEYGVVPTGYFVYRHMSDDDVFKFNLNQLGKKIAVSKEYPVFKTVNLDARFLLNKLNEGQEFKKFAVSQKKGGTRTRLYFNTLRTFESFLPAFEEQQKIADCLTSVDELITAQTQKLDALKTHKKGLIQQLFPGEGETVPKRRFPEFRGKEEWEEIELGELGELVSGLTYSPDDIRDEGLLVLRSSNVQNGRIALEDNVFVRSDIKGANLSKPNDILICVRNGSKSLIGKNALIPEGMPPCTHGAFMTVFRSKSAKFIFQLFQTDAYERQVSADLGATINSINGNQLRKYKFRVPGRDEQQKIADCLTSIDELISNQTQKVEFLKAHKKGLMQQLFPSVNEVGA